MKARYTLAIATASYGPTNSRFHNGHLFTQRAPAFAQRALAFTQRAPAFTQPVSRTLTNPMATLHQYVLHFERLGYKHHPFNKLFSWDTHCGDSLCPSNRKLAREYAMQVASKKFQSKFDINRSFHENGGDLQELEDDVERIFWAIFREEFPSRDDLIKHPAKYRTSVRMNLDSIRRREMEKKQTQDAEDRLRGAQKRYEKEQEYRQNIGDEEFNRRMVEEKQAKLSKGPKDNKEYLAFLLWRQKEAANAHSKYFRVHDQSSIVKIARGLVDVGVCLTSTKYNIAIYFNELIHHILKIGEHKVKITMEEGGFSSVPMQYVLCENSEPLKINGAPRSKIISGFVELYANCADIGLLVAFKNNKKSFKLMFPDPFQKFMDYTDPETGEYMGTTPNYHGNILYTMRGNITAEIVMENHGSGNRKRIIMQNYGTENVTAVDIVKRIVAGLEPTFDIEQRLRNSIKQHHDAKKAEGIAVQKIIQDKVEKTTKKKGRERERCCRILSMDVRRRTVRVYRRSRRHDCDVRIVCGCRGEGRCRS